MALLTFLNIVCFNFHCVGAKLFNFILLDTAINLRRIPKYKLLEAGNVSNLHEEKNYVSLGKT